MKNKTFGSSSTAEQVIDANHPSSMEGRIVVITGCNSGIGLETAKQFYRKNATVVMACRSEEKMVASRNEIVEQVPNSSGVLDMIVLDLGSLASVDSFAQAFTQKYDKLHTLILNAGIMSTPFGKTTDGFEIQIGTNYLGHFALTMKLIHLMTSVTDARIVSLSSGLESNGGKYLQFDDMNWEKRNYERMGAYGVSKVASIILTTELARRLAKVENHDIRTYAVDPGVIKTNLQRNDKRISFFVNIFGWLTKSIPQGAATTVQCATNPEFKESGKFYRDCQIKQPSSTATDEEIGRKLWEWSEKSTNTRLPF